MLVVAAALIAQMVLWMRRHGRGMRQSLQAEHSAPANAPVCGALLPWQPWLWRAKVPRPPCSVRREPGARQRQQRGRGRPAGVAAAVATAWAVARGLRFLTTAASSASAAGCSCSLP